MAYDAAHGDLVQYGSSVCNAPLQCDEDPDTWTFDGTAWTKHVTGQSGPSKRTDEAMAYDETSQRIVLFGGAEGFTYPDDTWTWDGSRWEGRQTTVAPAGRHRSVATYDSNDREVLMLNGEWQTQVVGSHFYDIWAWKDGSWTQLQASAGLAPQGDEETITTAARQFSPDCAARAPSCVVIQEPMIGSGAAYAEFEVTSASGSRIRCASYVVSQFQVTTSATTWKPAGVICQPPARALPGTGAAVQIYASTCGNVHSYPTGPVVGCLANGTRVTIDDGPIAIEDRSDPIWWHVQGRGCRGSVLTLDVLRASGWPPSSGP